MTHSQQIALRCAESLPKHLLSHRQRNDRRQSYTDGYLLTFAQAHHLNDQRLQQLDNCKSEEARRLILGVSR
jgi:hypothetical protein